MILLDTIKCVQCVAAKVADKAADGLDSIRETVDGVSSAVDSVTNALIEMGNTMDSTYKMIEDLPAVSSGEWIMAGATLCAVLASIGITIWQNKKHKEEVAAERRRHNTEVALERERHDEEVAAERANHQREVFEDRELRRKGIVQDNRRHFREVDLSRAEKEFDEVKVVGNALYDSVGMQYIIDLYNKCYEERNYAMYENDIKKLKANFSTAMHEFDMTINTFHLPRDITYQEEDSEENRTVNFDVQYHILYDYLRHFQKLMYFLKMVQTKADITDDNIRYIDDESPILRETGDNKYSFEKYCQKYEKFIPLIRENIRAYLEPIINLMMHQDHVLGVYVSGIFDMELAKRDAAYNALKKACAGNDD